MKRHKKILFFLAMVCFKLHAQNVPIDSVTEKKQKEAKKYLLGIGIPKDEPKAFKLYTELAQTADAKAMNMLGKLYSKGLGTALDESQAIYWFSKAAQNGIIEGIYNIGLLYKERPNTPDFEKAYKYFQTAANLGDAQSTYAVAYMHYKGLGCQQDYTKAASLFGVGAFEGRSNSMYFYGLCFRNGYGLLLNQDSVNYWLKKAASKGYRMAINELASTSSENSNTEAKTLSSNLKNDFLAKNRSLNKFHKIDKTTSAKVATGEYEGSLIRYDWSGKNAISTSKLRLKLSYQKGKVTGEWVENDTTVLPLEASINSSSLVFSNMKYVRKDHYSPNKGAKVLFKDANLQWSLNKDTMYLVGNIQMFTVKQNEPDKPIFISLKRYVGQTANIKDQDVVVEDLTLNKESVNIYPNPFVNTITVDFNLKQKSEVSIQLLTLDGKTVFEKKSGILDAGTYTFPLHVKSVQAGTYLLRVLYGTIINTTKMIKL